MPEYDMELLLALAVGLVASLLGVYALYAALLQPLRADSHSFRASQQTKSRQDRKLYQTPPSYFLNKDLLYLFHQEWKNVARNEDVHVVILLVHGFAEHSSRYSSMACQLLAGVPNCAVIALDHQGHGRSEGDRLFVREFADFSDDVLQLSNLARHRYVNAGRKQVILGHSMGGLIAIRTLQRFPNRFALAVISAPALSLSLSSMETSLAPVLSRYLPKLKVKSPIDVNKLCHSAMIVDLNVNDPLCTNGQGPTARLGAEMMGAIQEALAFAGEITTPYLLIRGAEDVITPREGALEFHRATRSADKSFQEMEGAFHEIFNEPDSGGAAAIAKVISWIQQRTTSV